MPIGIIDYGMGNVGSVYNALLHLGADATIVDNSEKLALCDKLILPGVGAFGDAMNKLQSSGFAATLRETVLVRQTPFLGICLGLQLICTSSEEFGFHRGLGWVDAKVLRFPAHLDVAVPHMGWNEVNTKQSSPLLEGCNGADFYFVHSYFAQCTNPAEVAGETDYGLPFASVLARDNIYAVQFHPEKSQEAGLRLLRNFIAL